MLQGKNEFYGWLKEGRRTWRILLSLVAGALQLVVPYAITYLPGGISCNTLLASIYGIQALVIGVCFCYVSAKPGLTHDHYPEASAAVRQFRVFWSWLWGTWFLMYFLFAVRSFYPAYPFWELIFNSLNNFQTFFVFLGYFTLAEPTTGKERGSLWKLAPVLVMGLIVVGILNVPFLPSTGQNSSPAANPVAPATLTETSTPAPVKMDMGGKPDEISKPTLPQFFAKLKMCQNADIISPDVGWGRLAFRMFSGLLAGIALALLVSRFESMYISAPLGVLIPLYLYAVIQVMWIEFGGKQYPYIQVATTFISLFFKLILFLLVMWLLESGKMLFYMEHVRNLYHTVNAKWLRFQEDLRTAEDKLREKLLMAYEEAKELKANVAFQLRMLSDNGALAVVQRVLNTDADEVSDYFAAMRSQQRLDLTVEAVSLHESFRELFSEDELQTARIRLRTAGYTGSATSNK